MSAGCNMFQVLYLSRYIITDKYVCFYKKAKKKDGPTSQWKENAELFECLEL